MNDDISLRERKKLRTRKALVEAAAELFERDGYEATGVADIAAAAEVSPSTFFRYFASKEAVLFADAQERVHRAALSLRTPAPGLRPPEALLQAVEGAMSDEADTFGRMGRVRSALLMNSPALRGLMAAQVAAAAQEITEALVQAFPDDLDELAAAAMVGALVGGLVGVIMQLLGGQSASDSLDGFQARARSAFAAALQELSAAVTRTRD